MQNTSVYSGKWCDQIFEGRNQKYGAYILRQQYATNSAKSLAYSVLLLVSVISIPVISSWIRTGEITNKSDALTVVELTDIPVLEIEKPREPVANSGGPKRPNDMMVAPVISDDDDTDDKDNRNQLNSNNDVTFSSNSNDTTGGDGGLGGGNNLVIPEDTSTYLVGGVEQMPEFPGGEDALLRFIAQNTNYPREFVSDGIDGTVYMQFVVNRAGKVEDISVLRGIRASKKFENEAARVLAAMPDWKPAKQNGHTVNVLFTLPIRFVLK